METSIDPTSLLILLSSDEYGPRQNLEEILTLLPTPFTPNQRPPLKEELRHGNIQDVENLPPVYLSSPEKYIALQEKKDRIGQYSREQFEQAVTATNPYEYPNNLAFMNRSIFMNRAAMKLANIDALYKLTHHLGAFMNLTTPGSFRFCDLAGSPGAFTQYVQWRRPESLGYGISLKSTDPGVPDWNMAQLDNHRFFPYYGESGTGNLYFEWRNFVTRVKRDQVLGLDLVMGDGGFDVEKEHAFNRQEFLSFRLIMVQVLTALKLLKEGGDFVLKMFDTVTEITGQLLYLVSLCFERISLFKPIVSRPANAERYLICQGKRKGTEQYERILEQANTIYNEDEILIRLLRDPLPQDFVDWLTALNDSLLTNQQQALDWIFDYLDGKQPPLPTIDLHKIPILFNVPGPRPGRQSKVRVYGAGRGIPFHEGAGIQP